MRKLAVVSCIAPKSIQLGIPVDFSLEKTILMDVLREFFVRKYKIWDDILVAKNDEPVTKTFVAEFGIPPYSGENLHNALVVYGGKAQSNLDKTIKSSLKLKTDDAVSQFYLTTAEPLPDAFSILEGPALSHYFFKNDSITGTLRPTLKHGFSLTSVDWIKHLNKQLYEDFIKFIFGIHEPGHIGIRGEKRFVNTPYGPHCPEYVCIMSRPEYQIKDFAEKVSLVQRLNPRLFCNQCEQELYS